MEFVHQDVTVTYSEKTDDWRFELRGRSRTAPTPAKAKEYIEKEPAPAKAKKFPRFDAYLLKSYDDMPARVEVTSIAEESTYGGRTETYYWVVDREQAAKRQWSDSGREKINGLLLVQVLPENEKIFAEIAAARSSIRAWETEIAKKKDSLVRIVKPEGF